MSACTAIATRVAAESLDSAASSSSSGPSLDRASVASAVSAALWAHPVLFWLGSGKPETNAAFQQDLTAELVSVVRSLVGSGSDADTISNAVRTACVAFQASQRKLSVKNNSYLPLLHHREIAERWMGRVLHHEKDAFAIISAKAQAEGQIDWPLRLKEAAQAYNPA